MRHKYIVLAAGALMASPLPNYAFASWMDSAPARFQIHGRQAAARAFVPPAADLTTGSLNAAPSRAVTRQSRPARREILR